MYHDILQFLYIPDVLINMHPHTKFQVATIRETLKSTSYKTVNLSLTRTCMYEHTYALTDIRNYVITYTHMHNPNTICSPASWMVGE